MNLYGENFKTCLIVFSLTLLVILLLMLIFYMVLLWITQD